MLSDKPLHATRAKAQESSGLQATRQGHTGQVVVLPAEDMQALNQFTGDIVAGFAPQTALERQLAQLYASYLWRINRAAAIEHTMFSLGFVEGASRTLHIARPDAQNALTYAMTFRSHAHEFEKMSLYSQSLLRQGEDVLRQLKQLQSERRKQVTRDLAAAARLYHFHQMQSRNFVPTENGFDLTIAQIEDHIRRSNLQKEALEAQNVGFDAVRYNQKCGNAAA